MNTLKELEQKSIFIIREAVYRFKKPALLWSIGKDSTVLLYLARKALFGDMSKLPVIHIDTKKNFPEMHSFRDKLAKKWGLKLVVGMYGDKCKNPENEIPGLNVCCGAPKTEALKETIAKNNFDALIVGIRRDEHGIRAKERVFSPRNKEFKWNYKNQPAELWEQYTSKKERDTHIRVHPLLHWTEKNIWEYIEKEKIPVLSLYFAKNGYRYRSLGCKNCSMPVKSNAKNVKEILKELKTTRTSERSGRSTEKEKDFVMQKLRGLGYM